MPLTAEQQKLLLNATRIQIIHALHEEPRTSQQVANLLRLSPGNVHYHIRKLHNGGLLTLTGSREVGGVVEKYYQAKAARFRIDRGDSAESADNAAALLMKYSKIQLLSQLRLTHEEQLLLFGELEELLTRWEKRVGQAPQGQASEWLIGVSAFEVTVDEENSSAVTPSPRPFDAVREQFRNEEE